MNNPQEEDAISDTSSSISEKSISAYAEDKKDKDSQSNNN